MKMKYIPLIGLAIALAASSAAAGPTFHQGGISLEIPEGFEGPRVFQPVANTTQYAYTSPYGSDGRSVLLQIAVADYTSIPEAAATLMHLAKNQRGPAAAEYLQSFTHDLASMRANFKKKGPEPVAIGNFPGARLTWSGEVSGLKAQGAFYCFIVGARAVVLQTQAAEGAPENIYAAAVNAISAIKIDARQK